VDRSGCDQLVVWLSLQSRVSEVVTWTKSANPTSGLGSFLVCPSRKVTFRSPRENIYIQMDGLIHQDVTACVKRAVRFVCVCVAKCPRRSADGFTNVRAA
jgi:hypothetical protein